MTTQNEVIRALRDFAHEAVFAGWRKMLTGRRTETNTITLAGAPAGKTWVRAHDASREQTAVWGFVGIPNVTVWVAPGVDGENRITALDYAESVQAHGNKVLLAQQPPLDGNLNAVLISGQNFQPGRLRAYAESGSMLVYVEPFAHRDGYYAGGTLDLTGETPTTSGTNAWVAVALDPATDTLYAYQGGESYDSISNLDVADAHAISVPDTYLKIGAVALNSDTTEITPGTRIIDLRSYLGAVGYPALDSLSNVDTTGKADGDALVWDAVAGEWVTGAAGGSIDVADGTTTVSPATELLFDATKFSVTDNGGGQAEVTLLGSGGMPAQKTTATLYVEEVIADVELGSAGTFDVSSIPAGYDDLRIVLVARGSAATTGVPVLWTFNADTTDANYQMQGSTLNNAIAGGVLAGRNWSVAVANTGTANFWTEIHMHLPLYADTSKFKVSHMNGADPRGAPNNQWHLAYTGIWKSTAAINRIQIAANNATNTFVAGSRLRILGIKQQQVVTDVTGGGLDTSTANVSNPPTDAELDSALGTPASVGAGYQCLLDDGGADTNVYLVTSNGTSWWFTALTKAT